VSERKPISTLFQSVTDFLLPKNFQFRVFLLVFLLANRKEMCYHPFDFI